MIQDIGLYSYFQTMKAKTPFLNLIWEEKRDINWKSDEKQDGVYLIVVYHVGS